jgi:hypothetical protein
VAVELDWLSTNLCHANFKASQNVGVSQYPGNASGTWFATSEREKEFLPKYWKKL